MKSKIERLRERIRAAKREIPADLVLKNGRVVNVFSGDIQARDVAIHGGFIAGVGRDYHGIEEVEIEGKWVVPGLMDGHIHIESSMLLPSRLAAALLPHGTTAIISDPHEMANVMGVDGLKFMVEDSQSIPFDVYFMAPSCVPATHLETSGARLGLPDLAALKDEGRFLGLGEMMNYPGLLAGDPEVLAKLILFDDKIIDGHAPSLHGYELQAYLSAGIRSDHETWDRDEGIEKLQSGMMLMIREGTSAKNLAALLPLITDKNSRRFCFVSDDLHPREILRRGHLDFMIRKAIDLGLDPVTAVQLASLNPAEYFGLRDSGAIAPGYHADLVVLTDLEDFMVDKVYKEGRLVVNEGIVIDGWSEGRPAFPARPIHIAPITPESFRIPLEGAEARIIELIPGQITTGVSYEGVKSRDHWVVSDIEKDILKLAVIERHQASGHIGLGLIRGFGLKKGALASSVAHDSHNIIAAGVSDSDLWRAVEEVRLMGGGLAVTDGARVLAKVPLEVAGLMSTVSLGLLTEQLEEVNRAARSLGCRLEEPFMSLSFLALPVIPELKLTDRGLVDVKGFQLVPLFVDGPQSSGY